MRLPYVMADQANDLILARDMLERILQDFPEDREAQEKLAQVRERERSREWRDMAIERARWKYQAKYLSEARDILKKLLQDFPEDREVQKELAHVVELYGTEPSTLEARFSVLLVSDILQIEPGQPNTLTLGIMNISTIVQWPYIEVQGVPDSWVTTPQQRIQLLPGQLEHIQLSIAIPKAPESRVGKYSVMLSVKSNNDPGDSSPAFSRWIVLPFFESELEIKPKRARGRWEGNYTIRITNRGNTGQSYKLIVEDAEAALEYIFNEERIFLGPGENVAIKLTVRPIEWKWMGETRIYDFMVRCQPETGVEQVVKASFNSQAVIIG